MAPDGKSQTVGPYRLGRELGRGAMGVVVEARRDDLDRVVALKLLPPTLDPEARLRFRREGELLARVRHPNVLAVHEVGEEDGVAWLACERVEGESLDEALRRGPLPPRAAAALVRAVAEGVGALHAAGVFHRDVKPANILLRPDGSPVLIDLGVAHDAAGPRLTTTHELIGTPAYLPPEQLAGGGRGSALGDVWALGAVLFTLLTGRPPFQGKTLVELAEAVRTRPVEWVEADAAPAALREVVERALARVPQARTPSALALAAALGAWLDESQVGPGPSRRRAGVAVAAGLLALAALGPGVGLGLRARRGADDPVAALAAWEAAVVEPWDLGLGTGRPPTPAEVEGWLARLRGAGREADDGVARLQAYRRLLAGGRASSAGPAVADRGLLARLEAVQATRSGQHAAAVRTLEARLGAAADDRAAARHLARAWEARLASASAGELGDAVEALAAWLARPPGPGALAAGGLDDVRRRAVTGLARAHAARVARRTFGAPTFERLQLELAEPARSALRLGVDAKGWSAATAGPAAAALAGAGAQWVSAAAAAAGDERRALDAMARARTSLAAEPAALSLAGAVLDVLLAPVLTASMSAPSSDARLALALRAARLDLASFLSGPGATPGALGRRAPALRLGEVMDLTLRTEIKAAPEVVVVGMRSCGHELGMDRLLGCLGGVAEIERLRKRWPWSRGLGLLLIEKFATDEERPQQLLALMSTDAALDLSPAYEARGWSCWVRDEGTLLHQRDVPADPAARLEYDLRLGRLVARARAIRALAPVEPTTLRQVYQGEVYGLRKRAPDRALEAFEEGLTVLRAREAEAVERGDPLAEVHARRELVKHIATGLSLFGEEGRGPRGLALAREAVAAIARGTGEPLGYEFALPWMRLAVEARRTRDQALLATVDEEITRLAPRLAHEGLYGEWVEVAVARGDRALARARLTEALDSHPRSAHLRAIEARHGL